MAAGTPIRVGICVQYTTGTFTLAFVIFKPNGDVILSQHYGDYQKLDDGTKFDPHVTYHADGTYHVAHYKGNPVDSGYVVNQKRQTLSSSFKGFETLVDQAFGRDYAKKFGRPCSGCDFPIIISADSIEDRSDTMKDSLGEHTIQLATASFRVDLLEPGLDPARVMIGPPNEELLYRELIKDTFAWCLVTIHRQPMP
jgi:hypothetical protein